MGKGAMAVTVDGGTARAPAAASAVRKSTSCSGLPAASAATASKYSESVE